MATSTIAQTKKIVSMPCKVLSVSSNTLEKANGAKYVLVTGIFTDGPFKGLTRNAMFTTVNAEGEPAKSAIPNIGADIRVDYTRVGDNHYFNYLGLGQTSDAELANRMSLEDYEAVAAL